MVCLLNFKFLFHRTHPGRTPRAFCLSFGSGTVPEDGGSCHRRCGVRRAQWSWKKEGETLRRRSERGAPKGPSQRALNEKRPSTHSSTTSTSQDPVPSLWFAHEDPVRSRTPCDSVPPDYRSSSAVGPGLSDSDNNISFRSGRVLHRPDPRLWTRRGPGRLPLLEVLIGRAWRAERTVAPPRT